MTPRAQERPSPRRKAGPMTDLPLLISTLEEDDHMLVGSSPEGETAFPRMKVRSTGQPVGEVARGESPEDTTEPKTSQVFHSLNQGETHDA
jgi:hypothetical protein